jgi:hypothetical protein
VTTGFRSEIGLDRTDSIELRQDGTNTEMPADRAGINYGTPGSQRRGQSLEDGNQSRNEKPNGYSRLSDGCPLSQDELTMRSGWP